MFCFESRQLRLLLLTGVTVTMLGCASYDSVMEPDPLPSQLSAGQITSSQVVTPSSQWVIVFEPGTNPQSFAIDHGLAMLAVLGEANLYLFQGAAELAVLEADPRVQSAQPNAQLVLSEPVDLIMGFYEGSWSEGSYPAQNALTGLKLHRVHQVATGDQVIIAVLDTGVDPTHPHLQGHIITNPIPFLGQSETTPNGIDEDGDGLVDEAFGHGTHVAGIIATVAPGARILPIRVLNDDGVGTVFDLAVGLYEAMFLQADIVNLSLSLSGYSPVISNLLQLLDTMGVQVVVAAGNTGTDPSYPATDPVTVGVAALDANQLLATFSGRGNVALGAPGVRVVSSFPGGQLAEASGTSMACAVVTGSLALMIERGRVSSASLDPRIELYESAIPITPSQSVLYGAVSPTRALGIDDEGGRVHLPQLRLAN